MTTRLTLLTAALALAAACQLPPEPPCDASLRDCGGGAGGDTTPPACAERCPGLDLCRPASGVCPQCFAGQGCSAPNLVCDEPPGGQGGSCVRCLASTHCGAGLLCDLPSRSCVAGLPETCDRPRELVLDQETGRGSLRLDTRGAADDVQPGCVAASGPDLAVRLHLDGPRDLTLTTTPLTPDSDAVLSLRSGSCAATAELACDDGFGRPDALKLENLPAGDHFILVDAYGADGAGEVQLDAVAAAATPAPGNDGCATAAPLAFAGATATAAGTTRAAANDAKDPAGPSCNTSARSSGRDVVYRLSLSQPRDVLLRVEPAAGSALSPVLALRPFARCDSGGPTDELGCKEGFFPQVRALNLQPGDYAVWVDSADGTDGTFTLTATLSAPTPPPVNDTCAGATALAFSGGVATASGSTAAARNDNLAGDESPFCSWAARSTGPDVLYRFTLAAAQDVEVKVTPTAGSPLSPVPYLRRFAQCASPAKNDELTCQSALGNAANTLRAKNLPPGDYALWVDTASDERGAFDLEVKLAPPTATPAGDTCLAPIPVALSAAGTQTLQGSTAGASDDYRNGCELGSSGPDVVYQLTLPAAATLRAAVTPVGASAGPAQLVLGRPWLSLREANQCASVTSTGSLGCVAAAAPGDTNRLTAYDLPPGTYALVVDTAGAGSGFVLELSTSPKSLSPPSNQSCATATPLVLAGGSARAVGSTANAANNTWNMACRSADAQQGKDVVYSFTTPALAAGQTSLVARVSVATQNADAFAPLLNVRQSCAGITAADQLLCEAASASPYLASGTVTGLSPSTTYYVWVDEAEPTLPGGAFTLSLDVAAGPAPNESCAAPQALATNATRAGSTLAASNHLDSLGANTWYDGAGCNVGLPGPDVVYQWTAGASGPAAVRVAPQLGYDVAVSLLSACAPSSCLAVQDSGDASAGETLAFTAVAGKTYFFAVDSYTGSATSRANRGGFVISVEQ